MMQELAQAVVDTARDVVRGIHTAFPGEIVSYDTRTGLATVLPKIRYNTPGGKTLEYPAITGVPVVFPQTHGQGATIAFPVKPGDGCLVIVAEQSLDLWMYGQETDTKLFFDLTNSICIPGLFNTANPVAKEACDKNAVIIDVSGTRLSVQNGSVTINSDAVNINGNVTINGNLTTQGDIVHLN